MASDHLITSDEARQMLQQLYAADGELDIGEVLRRGAADPIRPVSESGRFRPRLLLLAGGAMLFLLMMSFFYFTFGSRG